MKVLFLVIIAVISYLLGSLNFGVILSKKLEGDDVRNHGSGNAGTTNMLRNYGKKAAALTIIGDMLKVGVAIGIAFLILRLFTKMNAAQSLQIEPMLVKSFAGLFCVIGHIFPCFFNFRGGKGVATAGGMVFCIDWRIALILLAVFIVIVMITKYVSFGSIIMAILYPILIFAFYHTLFITLVSFVFTLIVLIAHRQNIKKLISGTESKINLKKKKEES